ncbi:MAG: ATP synthase F1 subunit delta [Deltaproteobacteria bacterium]|nr:ATP synthase F1 subunit delta [Deltaproteobacteria bacterium]
MKSSALARRFAKALMEIGREENAYENYGKELRTALAVFTGAPELYKVLLNPMYRFEVRRGLMEKVSESLKLSGHVAKFFNILVETRNIRILDDIVTAYSKLEDEADGRIKAVVESPGPLEAGLLDEIRKKLGGSSGKQVLLTNKTNPELLGGLVIRIENTILDGSLKTQLAMMKEKILEGVV